jgi:thiosulfate dehydrogenase
MEKMLGSKWFIIFLFVTVVFVVIKELQVNNKPADHFAANQPVNEYWESPSLFTEKIEPGENREQLVYGEDLIANTSRYLGPKGSIAQITNGMNCQNCHLNAGTKPFGNNYSAVASTYPKFRERSGSNESIEKRVNDCMERSLNGSALDSNSKEMRAMVAYIKWLGKYVKKGEKPKGAGITDLKFLDRAASPATGKIVYITHCQTCHGSNGEGVMDAGKISFAYPPLWGEHSYNNGAGLFRLSRFAGYVKDNMPFAATTDHFHPQLTDEEAWDVAAFVNSQPRPQKDLSKDWPDITVKPVDHPFGPYADGFTEQQHKYGPFEPIKKAKEEAKGKLAQRSFSVVERQ